jgi:N-acetylmuramoyl-L-alanine amidase
VRLPSDVSPQGRAARLVAATGLALAAVALLVGASSGEPPSRLEIGLEPHGTLRWELGATPVLLVDPARGDGWITIAERLTGGAAAARRIRELNGGEARVRLDRRVVVPVEALRGDLRLAAVRRLFPLDARTREGWRHEVLDPFSDGVEETWAWLAELFTGSPAKADALRRANPGVGGTEPARGSRVTIPEAVLLDAFRQVEPVATPTPQPTVAASTTPPARTAGPQPGTGSGPLEFSRDADGEIAVYRLRHGEALYSAVVVRFTGQLLAAQVNETAAEIARRSGIDDVTSIPIGHPIKIPVDLLLPQYLPPGDPRRARWEAERQELAGFLELVRAVDLSGVHVILDAGHGGVDSGAVQGGVWEAPYVYDITCRIRANLERHTRAKVWMTTEDPRIGCRTPATDRLEASRSRVVLTKPPYEIVDSPLGVHLRYYLTNDIILNRIGRDVPRSKTVFISIHADSLHPSVRGAMVYVPSRYLRPSKPYSVSRQDIKAFAEYRAHPTIRLGDDFKARVEASSRHLAESIVDSLSRNGIVVHPNEPVRDRVLRGRRQAWVPAVLRYSAAGNAVLVEVSNIGNDQDRELIVRHEWRERLALAVVEGLAGAYGD